MNLIGVSEGECREWAGGNIQRQYAWKFSTFDETLESRSTVNQRIN